MTQLLTIEEVLTAIREKSRDNHQPENEQTPTLYERVCKLLDFTNSQEPKDASITSRSV